LRGPLTISSRDKWWALAHRLGTAGRDQTTATGLASGCSKAGRREEMGIIFFAFVFVVITKCIEEFLGV